MLKARIILDVDMTNDGSITIDNFNGYLLIKANAWATVHHYAIEGNPNGNDPSNPTNKTNLPEPPETTH